MTLIICLIAAWIVLGAVGYIAWRACLRIPPLPWTNGERVEGLVMAFLFPGIAAIVAGIIVLLDRPPFTGWFEKPARW